MTIKAKIGTVFLGLLTGLIGSLPAADLVSLRTPEDLRRESQNRALVVFLSLDCDVGSYASDIFTQTFHDLSGPALGVYDINSFPYAVAGGLKYDLGTLLVIKNNRAVASSAEAPDPLDLMGSVAQRAWLAAELKKASLPFRMAEPGNLRRPPAPDPSETSDLTRGLLGRFTFQDKKDISGSGAELTGGMAGGIAGGIYSDTGEYKGSYTTLTMVNYGPRRTFFTSGFGFSFNVRLSSTARPWSQSGMFFSGGYRTFSVSRVAERLVIQLEPSREVQPGSGRYEDFSQAVVLKEVPFPLDQWVHVIFTGDYRTGRMKIMVDGRRLDDVVLTDQLLRLLALSSPFTSGQLGELGHMGRGAVLFGAMDDINFYDRALSAQEMKALADRDRKTSGSPSVSPRAPADLPPPSPGSQAGLWNGGWETFWGSSGRLTTALDLSVTGDQIKGTYDFKGGFLEGTVFWEGKDLTAEGTWRQSDGQGWFKFSLLPDGKSFRGQWGYENQEAEEDGWNGYRRDVTLGRSARFK